MFIEFIAICSMLSAVLGIDPVLIDRMQDPDLKILPGFFRQELRNSCGSNDNQAFFSVQPLRYATVELVGTNQRYPLKDLEQVFSSEFDYNKKTIIHVSGFASIRHDSVTWKRNIAKFKGAYNIIVMNFSINMTKLFRTVMYNMQNFAYAVLKLIDALLLRKVPSIILSGQSQGAQVTALAAKMFHKVNGWKLPLLVNLDPAILSDPANQYVSQHKAAQVLVNHGDSGRFGLKQPDYYPNRDNKLQPGCFTQKDFSVNCGAVPFCIRTPLRGKGMFHFTAKNNHPMDCQ